MSNQTSLISRFAPSPTGHLHLGHVISALYVWGISKALNAQIILRIEDHDQLRCKLEYEESILTDLEWLGLIPDDGVSSHGAPSKYRQSDNLDSYQSSLEVLRANDLVYGCGCSRKDLKARLPTMPQGDELVYDSFCRRRNIDDNDSKRLRLVVTEQNFSFIDGIEGKQIQSPVSQCGDFLIRDNNNQLTYQYTCSVDDLKQGINLIIRGQDLIDSTGRQMYLMDTLTPNRHSIDYYHHPLIYDNLGSKLSKQAFSEPIKNMREQGVSSRQIIGEAFRQLNISQISEKPSPSELEAYFCSITSTNDDGR